MIGHLIYTYNRLDDARILQEISKNYLSKKLGDIFLIHAYNGEKSFGYKKYLEDKLIQIENKGHFEGACDLINAGVVEAEKNPEIDYLFVTAADTWPLNTEYLKSIFKQMKEDNKTIATCSWDNRGINNYDKDFPMNLFKMGFATDFFFLDMKWQRENKLFPLDFKMVADKFGDIKIFFTGIIMYLEDVIAYSYTELFRKKYPLNHTYTEEMLKALYHLKEREPVHYRQEDGSWGKQMAWKELGLYTYHNNEVDKKKEALLQCQDLTGFHIEKLKKAQDLSYFNKVVRPESGFIVGNIQGKVSGPEE